MSAVILVTTARLQFFFIVSSTVFFGCSSVPSDNSVERPLVRDSAGVELILNPKDASTRPLGPMLSDSGSQTFGSGIVSGVTGARLLSDGRVVFTNDGARELVFVDMKTGKFERVGRAGEGPGEFTYFRDLVRCADDTVVVRSGASSVQVFTAQGEFVRNSRGAAIRGRAYGSSSNCDAIATDLDTSDEPRLGWRELESDSSVVVTTIRRQERQTIQYFGEPTAVLLPFAAFAVVAANGDQLLASRGDTTEIKLYDRRGTLTRVIRWYASPIPLSKDDRDRYDSIRVQLDQIVRAGTTAQIPLLSAFDLPKTKPLFVGAVIDDAQRIWVRRYPQIWDGFERVDPTLNTFQNEWWVFAPNGELLGTTFTPAGFTIKDIRGGIVLGVRADSAHQLHVRAVPLNAHIVEQLKSRNSGDGPRGATRSGGFE